MTGVLHQDSSRHGDTVGVEKDTRRSCQLRITVHIAAWRVEPRGRSGLVRQKDSVQLGRLGGRMAKQRPCRGLFGWQGAGWRRSGMVWAVRMASRPGGKAAALSGLFGWQGGRMAKRRPGRVCLDGKAAGWRRSGLVGAVRMASRLGAKSGLVGAVRMARRPGGKAASRSGAGRSGVVVCVDDCQVGRAG